MAQVGLGDMKTIIAGSRHIRDVSVVFDAADSCGWEITEIVSGGAMGVDKAGEIYAYSRPGKHIPLVRFNAPWHLYGRVAGPMRNKQMAEYADALILVWDGKSPGSKSMKAEALARGLRIHEVIVEV